MSKQPTTSAASDAATAQALQAIIDELEQARACSRHPVQSKALREAMPPEEGEDEVLIECPPAFSRQRFQSEALQEAMQNAFLAALKCGAFKDQNPKWVGLYIRRGNPNDLHVSDLLGYAKVKGYVDGLWDSAAKGPYPYKGLIDEAAGQLIELLRQEAAAGAAAGAVENFNKALTPMTATPPVADGTTLIDRAAKSGLVIMVGNAITACVDPQKADPSQIGQIAPVIASFNRPPLRPAAPPVPPATAAGSETRLYEVLSTVTAQRSEILTAIRNYADDERRRIAGGGTTTAGAPPYDTALHTAQALLKEYMRDLPALTVERVCNDLGCISLDALERVLWKLTDKKMLITEEARAPSLTTPPAPTSLQDSGHATAIPRPDLAHAIIANSTALQRLALEYQKKTRCTYSQAMAAAGAEMSAEVDKAWRRVQQELKQGGPWAKRFNELVDEFFQRQQLPGLRRPEGFQQWLGVAHEHGIWLPQFVEVVDAEIKQTAAEGGAGQSDKTSAPGSQKEQHESAPESVRQAVFWQVWRWPCWLKWPAIIIAFLVGATFVIWATLPDATKQKVVDWIAKHF